MAVTPLESQTTLSPGRLLPRAWGPAAAVVWEGPAPAPPLPAAVSTPYLGGKAVSCSPPSSWLVSSWVLAGARGENEQTNQNKTLQTKACMHPMEQAGFTNGVGDLCVMCTQHKCSDPSEQSRVPLCSLFMSNTDSFVEKLCFYNSEGPTSLPSCRI